MAEEMVKLSRRSSGEPPEPIVLAEVPFRLVLGDGRRDGFEPATDGPVNGLKPFEMREGMPICLKIGNGGGDV